MNPSYLHNEPFEITTVDLGDNHTGPSDSFVPAASSDRNLTLHEGSGFVIPSSADFSHREAKYHRYLPTKVAVHEAGNRNASFPGIWHWLSLVARLLCLVVVWFTLAVLVPVCEAYVDPTTYTHLDYERWRNRVALHIANPTMANETLRFEHPEVLEYHQCPQGMKIDAWSPGERRGLMDHRKDSGDADLFFLDCIRPLTDTERFCSAWYYSWEPITGAGDATSSPSIVLLESLRSYRESTKRIGFEPHLWNTFAFAIVLGICLGPFSETLNVLLKAQWGRSAHEMVERDRETQHGFVFRALDSGSRNRPPTITTEEHVSIPHGFVCEDMTPPLRDWPRSRLIRFRVRHCFYFASADVYDKVLRSQFDDWYQNQVQDPKVDSFEITTAASEEYPKKPWGLLLPRGRLPLMDFEGTGGGVLSKSALQGRAYQPLQNYARLDAAEAQHRKKMRAKHGKKKALPATSRHGNHESWFTGFPFKTWIYVVLLFLQLDLVIAALIHLCSERYDLELIKVINVAARRSSGNDDASPTSEVGLELVTTRTEHCGTPPNMDDDAAWVAQDLPWILNA